MFVQLFDLDPNENFAEEILASQIRVSKRNNILNGTVSDALCDSNPCLQNGTCILEFNDYEWVFLRGLLNQSIELVSLGYGRRRWSRVKQIVWNS